MFESYQGANVPHLRGGGGKGTLTPLIPLSLRAVKGEGERRTEAHVRAEHARGPLVQYWGEGEGFRLLGAGMTDREGKQRDAP